MDQLAMDQWTKGIF